AWVFGQVGVQGRRGEGRLAAWKAIVVGTLEPQAGVVLLVGANARENVLADLRGTRSDEFRVDALPHRLAETRFRPLPDRATDLGDRQCCSDPARNIRIPGSGIVETPQALGVRPSAVWPHRRGGERKSDRHHNRAERSQRFCPRPPWRPQSSRYPGGTP